MRAFACLRRSRLAVAALLALAGAAPGCGKKNTVAVGDAGGAHLVVYASDRSQAPGNFDLYLYDLDASGFRLMVGINSSTPELHPTISSDGRFVAFQSDRGAGARSNIYLYDRIAQGFVTPSSVNTPADETEPAFTGDAHRLAFVRVVGGFQRIFVDDGSAHPDTLVALPGLDTTATFNDWAPSPNLDASVIAFVSDRNGAPDVFVWQRGLGVRDIPALRSDSTDIEPSLSGDGRYVFFASNRTGGAGGLDIWKYDLSAGGLEHLAANTAANERAPSSSYDGGVLVFQSDRSGGLGEWDIWNLVVATGTATQGVQESSAGDDIQPSLLWR